MSVDQILSSFAYYVRHHQKTGVSTGLHLNQPEAKQAIEKLIAERVVAQLKVGAHPAVDQRSTQVKKCKRCEEIKPLDQYYKHASEKDGLNARCKTCLRQLRGYIGLMRIGSKVH